MPGCIVSATTASFRSVQKRRRRATPVMTSIFENVSDIGVCLGLYLGPPAKAGVRSKRGAVHRHERTGDRLNYRNGYRERSLDTRLGSLQLRIPKLRQGTYFPPFLEPRKTRRRW